MDESILPTRLDRIERRQKYILALLVVPYLAWFATAIGVLNAALTYVGLGVIAFTVIAHRRRNRNVAGQ